MGDNRVNGWTPDRKEQAKALWGRGLSASQIAAELGPPWLTRNAVIGLITRSGLARGTPRRTALKPARTARPRPERRPRSNVSLPPELVVPVEVALPEPKSLDLPLTALGPFHCRWPHGDPGNAGFGFCGAPRTGGGAYCEHHAKRAFVPVRVR